MKTYAPSAVRLHRILVPIDFSVGSKKALKYAGAFASQFESDIVILHVVESYPAPTGDLALDLARLQFHLEKDAKATVEQYRRGLGPRATGVVKAGSPPHVITETAAELGADLIVMGTHGRTGLAHFALGSVAERVVQHSKCPVLVVRDPERDFVSGEQVAEQRLKAGQNQLEAV